MGGRGSRHRTEELRPPPPRAAKMTTSTATTCSNSQGQKALSWALFHRKKNKRKATMAGRDQPQRRRHLLWWSRVCKTQSGWRVCKTLSGYSSRPPVCWVQYLCCVCVYLCCSVSCMLLYSQLLYLRLFHPMKTNYAGGCLQEHAHSVQGKAAMVGVSLHITYTKLLVRRPTRATCNYRTFLCPKQ